MGFLEKIARKDFKIKSGQKVSFILFSNKNTSTAFVFVETGFWPVGVLRISTSGDYVTREHKILKLIANKGGPSLACTVPQPIDIHFVRKRVVSSQSFVGIGKMRVPKLWGFWGQKIVHQHLKGVREWLSHLARVPVEEGEVGRSYRVSEAVDFIMANKEIKGSGVSIKVLQSWERLQRFSIPQLINHKDLYVDNILWDKKGGLCVLDWEYSTIGYPMFDWFFFVCDYSLSLFANSDASDEHIIGALKKAFLDDNWFSKRISEETVRLCRDLSLPGELIPDFYILGVVDFLYRRLDRNLLRVEKALSLLNREALPFV